MRWLLPEHIEDILPAEAMRIEVLRRRILDLFFGKKYKFVIPPLVEFTDSLLTGTGRDLDLRTFKLVDQLSGRMMGVRADITPQVARIGAADITHPHPPEAPAARRAGRQARVGRRLTAHGFSTGRAT